MKRAQINISTARRAKGLFSRFKEKLSGFKEALSSKIAEKVSLAEKIAGKKDDGEKEIESHAKALPEADGNAAFEKSPASSATLSSTSPAKPSPSQIPEKTEANNKPKNRFSFLEKAKSLIFEQEVILEEKDLVEPMWALEMALMESDVALPVAEEIIREVKSDLVGKK
ncbi:MAG: signal recognition particle receptor subunit alpha, partial [Methanothrix sp.]